MLECADGAEVTHEKASVHGPSGGGRPEHRRRGNVASPLQRTGDGTAVRSGRWRQLVAAGVVPGTGRAWSRPLMPPTARSLRRRRPFLRTARLNAVGWGARLGACTAAAAASAPVTRRTGWSLLIRAGAGPAAVVTALVVLDRRRWRAMEAGLSFTDDAALTAAVVDRLVADGLPVHLDEGPGKPGIRYANRYGRRIETALEALLSPRTDESQGAEA